MLLQDPLDCESLFVGRNSAESFPSDPLANSAKAIRVWF
jgi:hypothetical protein